MNLQLMERNYYMKHYIKVCIFSKKAKKYVRDYPSRDITSLDGFIEPLRIISNNFDLSDSFDNLNKKLGARYPNGFVINGIR